MKESIIRFFFSETIHNIKANIKMTLISIAAFTACLLMLGSTIIGYRILASSIQTESQKTQYSAYIDESLSLDEAYALQNHLLAIDNVASVEFESREDAAQEFAEYIGSDILTDLPADTFRHRYLITFRDPELAASTMNEIKKINGVANTSGSLEISAGFVKLNQGVSVAAIFVCVLLFIIAFVVIVNTLSYSMEKKTQETRIMRLCGISEIFIRTPFLMEGIFIGGISAVVGFLIQWGIYNLLYSSLNGIGITAILDMPGFHAFFVFILILYITLGITLGLIGGILSGHHTTLKKRRQKGGKRISGKK